MSVAKVGKSGGSGGVLNYVLKDEHAQIIGGNVAGEKDEIKEQFEAFEDSRPSLTKNTTHITWSFAPGEEVSDEKAVKLAEELLEKLKFEKSPYLIVRHSDKEKREKDPYQHIHIIAGRIRADASVVPDFQIARRTIEAVKELEKAYDLQQTPFIDRSEERQPKREELKMIERTGELSARLKLQEQIKEVAADFPETKTFVEELERRGVAVEFNIQKTGRIAGVSFETDGVAFKGSSLGKNYSWNGLQKQQGLNYEHERDFNACQAASQRVSARRLEGIIASGDRTIGNGIEPNQSPELGNVGEFDRPNRVRNERENGAQDRTREQRESLSKARAADRDTTTATAERKVSGSEHNLNATINKGAGNQSELERNSQQLWKGLQTGQGGAGEQRIEGRNAEDGFKRSAAQHEKLEGRGGKLGERAGKLESLDLGGVEIRGNNDDFGVSRVSNLDGDLERSRNQRFDLDARAENSNHESVGTMPATGAGLGDESRAEQHNHDKAQDAQKARAVTQSINLAYGGSLPNEVQEQMTMQLAEHPQLDDYYERSRLTRWQETIGMSQNFVEATARSLSAAAPPQPPETDLERNERLKGWMQATVQVAVYEQTGRELDKEVLRHLGERFAEGYEKTASDKEISKLEQFSERNGVAPPFVERQSETRAAILMNAMSEEIAAPVLAKEREFVQERAEQAQALEQAKQERQQTRERGGYEMSR